MQKVRVYQLAKELRVQSALIIELLDRMGQDVKSDLSTLDSSTADVVRERVTVAIDAEKQRLAAEAKLQKTAAPEEGAAAAEPDLPAAAAAAPPERPAASVPALPVPAPAPTAAAAAAPGVRKPRVFPARRIPTPAMLARTTATKPATPGVPPRPPVGARAGTPGPARPGSPGPMPGRPPVGKRRRKAKTAERHVIQLPTKPKPELPPVPEAISLSEGVTVKELAEKLGRKSKDVIAKLISRGVLATINQPINPEVAIAVAEEFGSTATILSFEEEAQRADETPGVDEAVERTPDRPEDLKPRAPVVTVMGHVDHGKTSLLDAIRTTNVVDREAGGITQHIGAYQVEEKGRKITFLDTPGHEAFTMMRARGARATDIVVLVVAADDGVKPQTLEAIDHARAADVPIVVAINKIDKPGANSDRVKQQLADRELLVEQYGGTVVSCEVSAKQRIGLDDLLEMILLVADMKELQADPEKAAAGVVLEARRDRSKGIVATVLVQEGTLKVGDPFIAGAGYGKVRAMADEYGRRIEAVGPSTPIEVMGFAVGAGAGDSFQSVATEAKARQIAAFRQEKEKAERQRASARRTLENLAQDIASGEIKDLSILLKSDVHGSIEAIQKALADLPTDKVRVKVLHSGVGAISQADVLLAAASSAIVVGFNVRPDKAAAELAKQERVDLRMYTVIYELVDEIKQAMVGLLEPTLKEHVLGQAAVRQVFKVPKIGNVAGCYVTDGKITRNGEVRLLRDNVVIHTGKVDSLRRFKDDASEVKQGFECGIGIAGYNDLKEGDVIECFEMLKIVAKTL